MTIKKFKYFSPETDPRLFFCSETGEQGIKDAFVHRLDELRERCGFSLGINSGIRSVRHSAEAEKEEPGPHTEGISADVACTESWKRYIILKNAFEMGFSGIAVMTNAIHIDDRQTGDVTWTY